MTTLAPESQPSPPPSPYHQALARHAWSIIGGKPVVRAYHHGDVEGLSIDLLEIRDQPEEGLVSYSTLGLFESELRHDDGEPMKTRIELCADMPEDLQQWANVMATAAFALMRGGQAVRPGSVLPDCVAEFYPKSTTPHLYLCAPFAWNDGEFPRVEFDAFMVNWLQVFPISQAELDYIEQHGGEAFEDQMLEHDPDIYDLTRKSLW